MSKTRCAFWHDTEPYSRDSYTGVDTLDEPITTTIVRSLSRARNLRLSAAVMFRVAISSPSTPNLSRFSTRRREARPAKC